MIPFEKNMAFEHSCRIRPIKGFHPETLLELDLESFRRYLSHDSKLLWFHQYCLEQGHKGTVETEFSTAETLKDIPDSNVQGSFASLVKEYWTATVFINGEEISRAMVSGTFMVNDQKERDTASNQLRKSAIGAALSQAGFGVISAFNLTVNEIASLKEALAAQNFADLNQPSVPAPSQASMNGVNPNPALPFTAPNPFVNAGNTITGAPVVSPPPAQRTNEPPAAVQEDPLEAAKRVVWPGNGPHKGKTLGEILSAVGGAKNIAWLANDYAPRSAEGMQAQEAARTILRTLQFGN